MPQPHMTDWPIVMLKHPTHTYVKYNNPNAHRRVQKTMQGVQIFLFCNVINVLDRGPYEPPLRSNWTKGILLRLQGRLYKYF